MTHRFASPRYRNLLSWIVGYSNTIGSITGLASIDWGCAVQIAAGIEIGSGYEATNAVRYGVFAAIVVSHVMICCLGTSILARLQTFYITMNIILCLVIIIALPAATHGTLKNDAAYTFGHVANLSDWPAGFGFVLSFLAPMWTINGYDSCLHISEEASNASIAVPWGIVLSTLVAGVLGWAINVALAFCMGKDIETLATSSQPMAQILNQSFGTKGSLVLWAFVIVLQFMMGSSSLLSGSRQTFAFARDGALPLSRVLYRMNAITHTPVNTVLFNASCALALGLLAFAPGAAISAVFTISVTANYVAYGVPIASRWIWRAQNAFTPGPFSLGWFSFPCAVIACGWMSFMGVIVLFPTSRATDVQNMNYSAVILGGTLLLSLAWYYCPVYGGVHWFRGPMPNLEGRSVQPWYDDKSEEVEIEKVSEKSDEPDKL